jgi:subtilase family serine protease
VSDAQAIRVVIDSSNKFPETNKGNNEMTVTGSGASHTCWQS